MSDVTYDGVYIVCSITSVSIDGGNTIHSIYDYNNVTHKTLSRYETAHTIEAVIVHSRTAILLFPPPPPTKVLATYR